MNWLRRIIEKLGPKEADPVDDLIEIQVNASYEEVGLWIEFTYTREDLDWAHYKNDPDNNPRPKHAFPVKLFN